MTHLSTKLVPVRFSMDESRVVHRATPFWALEVSTEGRTRSLCRRSSSVDKLSGSKMSLERGSTAWLSVSGRPQIASSEHVNQALVSVASMLPTRRPLLKRLQDFRWKKHGSFHAKTIEKRLFKWLQHIWNFKGGSLRVTVKPWDSNCFLIASDLQVFDLFLLAPSTPAVALLFSRWVKRKWHHPPGVKMLPQTPQRLLYLPLFIADSSLRWTLRMLAHLQKTCMPIRRQIVDELDALADFLDLVRWLRSRHIEVNDPEDEDVGLCTPGALSLIKITKPMKKTSLFESSTPLHTTWHSFWHSPGNICGM